MCICSHVAHLRFSEYVKRAEKLLGSKSKTLLVSHVCFSAPFSRTPVAATSHSKHGKHSVFLVSMDETSETHFFSVSTMNQVVVLQVVSDSQATYCT